MEASIFKIALFIHVLAGVISLSSGLVAMSYGKKGGKVHNIAGNLFYWAMAVIFLTTILFFILYPGKIRFHFFLMIGIVSFYPNWSGKRMLVMKKGLVPTLMDKIAAYGIGISGICMLIYAVFGLVFPEKYGDYAILFIIFGIVSLSNSYGDLKFYLNYKTPIKMHWFFAHGGKMMGAYTAALTAFCVNIVPRFLPENSPSFVYIFTWVAPGVVFGIVSFKILKRYKIKFGIA